MDISVIIPLYHGNRYVNELIKQIENAIGDNGFSVEMILVNDSPDEPVMPFNHSSKFVIRVIELEENTGIHRARVRGLDFAVGKYILFLDQDDIICNNFFEKQLNNIVDRDVSICAVLNGDRREFVCERYSEHEVSLYGMINEGNFIRSPGQTLIRKGAIPQLWKELIMKNNGADDWMLWILMLKNNCRFSVLDEVLFIHSIHEFNTSARALVMHESEQELKECLIKAGVLSDKEGKIFEELLKKQDRKRFLDCDSLAKKASFYKKLLEMQGRNLKFYDAVNLPLESSIYIYGFGEIGKYLYKELNLNGYNVLGYIDRDAESIRSHEKVVKTGEDIVNVDFIIISLLRNEKTVKDYLYQKYNAVILTLSDLIKGEE